MGFAGRLPYLDQQVWLKGSVVIENASFTQTGSVWYTPWTLFLTNALNSSAAPSCIEPALNPIPDWGDMVFDRNGEALRQVPTLAEVGPGRFCVDPVAQRLYVGDDPADLCPVEAAACMNGLFAYAAQSVTIRGIGVTHFAGTGIWIHSATGWIENCVSIWNGAFGVRCSFAPGSELRGCTLSCNGSNGGFVGNSGNMIVERNGFAYNNTEHFSGYIAAGLKLGNFGCSNLVIRNNVFERNYANGLWLDVSIRNALVVDNIARFNTKRGLFVEISHSNSVAFNTSYGNDNGIVILDAPHNRVYNNTVVDNTSDGVKMEEWDRVNPGVIAEDAAALADGNAWNAYSNHVVNNLMCGRPASGFALFGGRETYWPGQASFGARNAMVTLSKNNLYHRPDGSVPLISARANLSAAVTNYTDLALFRQHYPGFEAGSASYEGADPFFRDVAARDYRPRAGGAAIGAAAPLPADLAALCGRPVNIGYAGALAPWDEGWWRFNETGGNDSYDSAGSNCGTNYGGVARVPGKGCGALSFDGSNDWVGFGTNLAHLTGALTVSAWVKPDRPPSAAEHRGRIIANTFVQGTPNRGWLLGKYWGETDDLQFTVYSSAGGVSASFPNFFKTHSNRWVHVAGVFKPGEYVALYTNGVLAASNATALTSISYTNVNLRIGNRADNVNQGVWSGLIDEVRVFGAALNADELSALMPAAEGRWRFDETDGLNKAYDSVNVNTGSVINAEYKDEGKSGRALWFNGIDSRVDLSTNLAHLTSAITVSAWVRPLSPPVGLGRVIASTFRYNADNKAWRGWQLGCLSGSSDAIQFQVSSPTGGVVYANCNKFFANCSNRWVHVAGVFKPGEYVALYTNGVRAAFESTTFTAIGTTNTNMRIGMWAHGTGSRQWSGLIDEVAVYDGALPPSALAAECAAAPNQIPEVTITLPAAGASFRADEAVLLEADAFDSDGDDRIARVYFYADRDLLGVCTRRPYRFLWKNHVAGIHRVKAKACDTRGAEITSAAVDVSLRSLLGDFTAGHWRFDETNGYYSSDSVGSNHGTNYGGVARMPGRLNGALSFDGANDYVGFGTNLAHLTGALTVSAWVKPDRPPSAAEHRGRIIANTFVQGTPNRGWLLGKYWGETDDLQFTVYSSAGGVSASFPNFFKTHSNRWVHVAGVFRPGEYVALYTNGVLAATNAAPLTAIAYANVNLRIGNRADNLRQGQWSGLIDEVRVFGAALPQDELNALCSAPAGEWRFDTPPDAGGTAQDSVEDNDGTLGGGVPGGVPTRVAGKSGGALSFDGADDRVDFTTNFAHLAGALTVAAWVKPSSPPIGVGRVIASTFKYNADTKAWRGWQLGCLSGSSDALQFQVSSPAGGVVAADCKNFFANWSNRWVHVTGVFKPGEQVELYTNGTLASRSLTSFTAIGTTNANLRIGMWAHSIGTRQWSGLIDEVRLYEGALPLFAVQALDNNQPVGLPGILSEPLRPARATVLMVR